MELDGKNVLVTGAAKRLGRAIAISLANKGANVAIHYQHSGTEAEDVAQQISAKGLKGIAIRADIRKTKRIEAVVREAHEYLGGIDILVNNAAIFYPTPVDKVKEEDWEGFFGVNLKAQFYFSRAFASLEHMTTAKIINMADSYGISPSAKFIPYGISKGGVILLTRGLAKAYAPNIMVNCICPGPILPREGADEELQQKAVVATLLKRCGTAEDITKTVIFLAENDYITGQAIFIDGGRSV